MNNLLLAHLREANRLRNMSKAKATTCKEYEQRCNNWFKNNRTLIAKLKEHGKQPNR